MFRFLPFNGCGKGVIYKMVGPAHAVSLNTSGGIGSNRMKKILIIEDDREISALRKDMFEAEGYAVELAASADAGLRKAMREPFGIIILDMTLPGRDRFDICQVIRQSAAAPILMVAAKQEDVDAIRDWGTGADDYMVKPFSVVELVARAKVHLSLDRQQVGRTEGESSPNDQIRTGGLLIDKLMRKVYVEEREVALTAKEFDLLQYLAANPNRLFTKEELFERVWGLDSMGDLPTVTVHISKLREKIEPNPSKPQFVETVWGAGYRFNMQK